MNIQHEETGRLQEWPTNKPIPRGWAKVSAIFTADDFKRWGAQGGRKSKRELSAAQAKAMVAARERKRRKTKRVARRANDQGEPQPPTTGVADRNDA